MECVGKDTVNWISDKPRDKWKGMNDFKRNESCLRIAMTEASGGGGGTRVIVY